MFDREALHDIRVLPCFGRGTWLSHGEPCPVLCEERFEVERRGRAAGVTLDQCGPQYLEMRFTLFKQTEAHADHIAKRIIASGPNPLIDEVQ